MFHCLRDLRKQKPEKPRDFQHVLETERDFEPLGLKVNSFPGTI